MLIMEKNYEVTAVSLNKELKKEAQKLSKEFFGYVNLSGFVSYLISKEIRENKKETASNMSV